MATRTSTDSTTTWRTTPVCTRLASPASCSSSFCSATRIRSSTSPRAPARSSALTPGVPPTALPSCCAYWSTCCTAGPVSVLSTRADCWLVALASNAVSALSWPVRVATKDRYCWGSRVPDLTATYPIACSSPAWALAAAKSPTARIESASPGSVAYCAISTGYATRSSMITPYRTTASAAVMPCWLTTCWRIVSTMDSCWSIRSSRARTGAGSPLIFRPSRYPSIAVLVCWVCLTKTALPIAPSRYCAARIRSRWNWWVVSATSPDSAVRADTSFADSARCPLSTSRMIVRLAMASSGMTRMRPSLARMLASRRPSRGRGRPAAAIPRPGRRPRAGIPGLVRVLTSTPFVATAGRARPVFPPTRVARRPRGIRHAARPRFHHVRCLERKVQQGT